MANPNDHRLALFIDFENLVTNTGISPSAFDLQPSLDRLLERGKVIFRRAYADWSRFREAKAGLHALGVELVDVPPSTSAGKNAADMRLVIDALELNYARQHIDTFVIASGDSDFVPLANKLRENDRRVIGIAVKDSTSPYFVRACDEFLYLPVSGGGRGGRGGGQEKDKATQRARGGGQAERSGGGKDKKPAAVVPGFARDVVKSLLSRATGPLNPSLIKETIVRKEPDFDERDHGFSTFSRLLEALEKEGLLKLQQLKGRQWYVLPVDGGPGPAPAAAEEELDADVEEEESIPDPEL
ncbi:MAG: NYN domain-containing protein [Deltaproteobacteria bacterium]|nr:NYN domain-containing protein [Deltaproteobacteria bacterium]